MIQFSSPVVELVGIREELGSLVIVVELEGIEEENTRVPSGSGCEMSSRYTSWILCGWNGNSTSFTEVRSNPGTESLEIMWCCSTPRY